MCDELKTSKARSRRVRRRPRASPKANDKGSEAPVVGANSADDTWGKRICSAVHNINELFLYRNIQFPKTFKVIRLLVTSGLLAAAYNIRDSSKIIAQVLAFSAGFVWLQRTDAQDAG
jgi:hypothetical protein